MTTKGLAAHRVLEIRDDKDLDSSVSSDPIWGTWRISELLMETLLQDLETHMKATREKNSRALTIVPSPILEVICCPHVVN